MPEYVFLLEPGPTPLSEAASIFEDLFVHNELSNADTPDRETLTAKPDSAPTIELDELPDAGSIEKNQDIDDGNKDPKTNEPYSEDLAKLRSYINHIEWGKIWFALSKNKAVAEFAWRDNNVVLFATTVGDPMEVVNRPRKRPGSSSSVAAKTGKVFGNEVVKNLDIPQSIDEYNQQMGAVDQFDQLKSYYDTRRIHRKTWRSLFSFLLEVVLINCFKLSTLVTRAETKHSGHRKFRLKPIIQLEDAAGRAVRYDSRRRRSVNDLKVKDGRMHVQGNLLKQSMQQPCVVCQAKGHRGALQAVDANASSSAKKTKSARTTQRCVKCDVPLCADCCKRHLQAADIGGDSDGESTIGLIKKSNICIFVGTEG